METSFIETRLSVFTFTRKNWNHIDILNTKGDIFSLDLQVEAVVTFPWTYTWNIYFKVNNLIRDLAWAQLFSYFKRSDIQEAVFHELANLNMEWAWSSSITKHQWHHWNSKMVDRKPCPAGMASILLIWVNFGLILWL